jgi:hypothetical protein
MSSRSSVRCVQNDFKPMACSMQTVHLFYVKISTISKQTETSFHLSHVTLENHRVRPKCFLHWRKTVHLSCTYFNTVSKRTKTSFHVSLVTLEYHRLHPKCFLTLVCLAQTMVLSCSDPNTVSKQTEMRFHSSQVI